MPEDFDPSPRSSKRRKVNTYGSSRSTRSEHELSTSSIWENVSSSVTGLSRRLFSSNKSKTLPENTADAAQGTGENAESQNAEDTPEIAESEEEQLAETAPAGARRNSRREGMSNGETITPKSNAKKVNGDSSTAKSSTKNTRTRARRTTNGSTSRGASGGQLDRNGDAPEETTNNTTNDIVMEDVEEDSITFQPRSSGRARKRTSKVSLDSADVQEKPKSRAQSASKAKNVKEKDAGIPKETHAELVGILTPSKRNEKKARKSVVFEESEKQVEKDFGFKDISTSTKKPKRPTPPVKRRTSVPDVIEQSQEEFWEEADLGQSALIHEEIDDDDLLFESIPAPGPTVEDIEPQQDATYLVEDSPEIQQIKAIVLARLTNRAPPTDWPPLPSHLKPAYETLHTLLHATITSGESNSLLLLGSRGAGKTLLVDTALSALHLSLPTDFHTVRLNGFIQTDDRLALREIWRQLGREMDVDESETAQVSGSYADTMTSLLGLLSQPEEVPDIGAVEYAAAEGKVVTKSVVFVLDEFDLFTTHARQTLLYNLFDIAQSRKAPIAVVGCSARTDCVDCLEKRVKSRFSHRWVHVAQPRTLVAFEDVVRDNLLVDERRVGATTEQLASSQLWNEYIKTTFLPSPSIQSLIHSTFYTTKSLPSLFAALYIPIATAIVGATPLPSVPSTSSTSSTPPNLITSLLPHLPHIHLALLVCATRLEAIHSLQHANFNIVHAHYVDLHAKARLLAASAGGGSGGAGGVSGMRVWGREVCLRAWEDLIRWEVLVRVGGRDEGVGEEGRMCRVEVSVEEVRWAVEGMAKGSSGNEGLARWCREV